MERELQWAVPPELQQHLAVGGVVLALVVLYFLPFLVAVLRRHPSALAIFSVNLFLGWTITGWVVALAWSLLAINVRNRYR